MSFLIGLPPHEFWALTPWQFKCCLESYGSLKNQEHDESAWLMWHGAALGRIRKMPPLSDFMADKKAVQGIDEHAIIARLKQYQTNREHILDGAGSQISS